MVKTLTRNPDCPPAAGSLNPAALNDTKAVLSAFLWLVTVPFNQIVHSAGMFLICQL